MGALSEYPTEAMRVGINFPWVACGHDFGPEPVGWSRDRWSPRDWSRVERELGELRAMGVEVVRFWILAGGVGYPVGEELGKYARVVELEEGPLAALADAGGPVLGRLARRFRPRTPYRTLTLHDGVAPPPLPEPFLEDFVGLLAACREAGVQLLPSLLSFEWFQPLVDAGTGVTKRGREAFVFAPEVQAADEDRLSRFLDATLDPLIAACATERDALYALEVINEPGWAVHGSPPQVDAAHYGNVPTLKRVSPRNMSRLVARGVERIATAGLVASVGFGPLEPPWLSRGAWATLERHAAAGRYVHQVHPYPTLLGSRSLPVAEDSPVRPCIVGELPTAPPGSATNARFTDPDVQDSERDPSRFLEARLWALERRGFDLCLLWAAHATDPRALWDESTRRQVERFTAARTQQP